MGEATATSGKRIRRNRYKGRKGFYLNRQGGEHVAARRPENTSIVVLMSDERCIPAMLKFLGRAGCGKLKEGVVLTGRTP